MKRRHFIQRLLGAAAAFQAVPPAAGPERFRNFGSLMTEHLEAVRVSDSVFSVRGREATGIPTNSAIIVGDTGVAFVDTHQRPSFDAEMLEIGRRITALPVRYLINTHWHQDHTLGNQEFAGVPIVAHVQTKADMADRVARSLTLQKQVLPDDLEAARGTLHRMRAAGASEPEIRALETAIRLDEEYVKELATVRLTLPDRTFEDRLRLDIAAQPIELRFLGKGHTRGDIVVHLPEEKVIITGDLLTAGQPFMRKRDAVPSAWGSTLAGLRALLWDRAVPGHGVVPEPRKRLDVLISFLSDLVLETQVALNDRVPEGEFVDRVRRRLARHAPDFPYFNEAVVENIERTREDLSRP